MTDSGTRLDTSSFLFFPSCKTKASTSSLLHPTPHPAHCYPCEIHGEEKEKKIFKLVWSGLAWPHMVRCGVWYHANNRSAPRLALSLSLSGSKIHMQSLSGTHSCGNHENERIANRWVNCKCVLINISNVTTTAQWGLPMHGIVLCSALLCFAVSRSLGTWDSPGRYSTLQIVRRGSLGVQYHTTPYHAILTERSPLFPSPHMAIR